MAPEFSGEGGSFGRRDRDRGGAARPGALFLDRHRHFARLLRPGQRNVGSPARLPGRDVELLFGREGSAGSFDIHRDGDDQMSSGLCSTQPAWG